MEIQETITEFIKPELLVLIPVLFFIGVAIVKSNTENKFIPFILMGTGIALSGLWVFATSEIATSKRYCISYIYSDCTRNISSFRCGISK